VLLRGSVTALIIGCWVLAAPACGGDASNGGAGAPASFCSLPQDSGVCLAYIPRFWFNSATGRCEAFVYGGCGGNENNFESASDCIDACAPGTPNACSKTDCLQSDTCAFVGTRPANCFTPCTDAGPSGGCLGGQTCECGGSCPGCENCIQVCVPI
jgi:hypothetical protein